MRCVCHQWWGCGCVWRAKQKQRDAGAGEADETETGPFTGRTFLSFRTLNPAAPDLAATAISFH